MRQIFLVKHDSFIPPGYYYAICTAIEQYSFTPDTELFNYKQSIMVNKPITRQEAEMLYDLVKHNGTGNVCGGKSLETIEL